MNKIVQRPSGRRTKAASVPPCADFQKWLEDDTLKWSLWAWAAQELEYRQFLKDCHASGVLGKCTGKTDAP